MPGPLRTAWVRWVPLALVLLGAAMRVRQWLGGRSLWLDETLVARSLVSRDYTGLVAEPLQGDQAAPVLWLWATRLSIDLFGDGERALRLATLLGGLVALGLLWLLARRVLPAGLVPVALLVVVLNPAFLYFSNDVKPYSWDVAAVVGVVLLALRVGWPARPDARVVVLAVAGSVLVWASYAVVFALAGVSLVLVLGPLLRSRLRQAVGTGLVLSAWLVSLGVSYVTVLSRHRESTVLSTFWDYSFPTGVTDLPAWLGRRAADLADDPLELAAPLLALLLLVVGTVRLVRLRLRRDRAALALAVVPMGVLAAALSVYPLAGRLALWLVPVVALTLAASFPARLHRGDAAAPRLDPARVAWAGAAGLALAAVLVPSAAVTLPQVATVQEREELRPVMEQVRDRLQPGERVVVEVPTMGPFDFYSERVGLSRDAVVHFTSAERFGGTCADENAVRSSGLLAGRVWLVFAHPLSNAATTGTRRDLLNRFAAFGTPVEHVHETGAEAFLFDAAPGPSDAFADEPRNEDRCLEVIASRS